VDADPMTRERRTRQFEHYLGLMEHRAVTLQKSDCFVIFSVPIARQIRRRVGGATSRCVQYAFLEGGFYLDLPDSTLLPEEAKRIVAERTGFGFALNNPLKRDGERKFDPLQRQYRYSEQRTAAEDAAYVMFDVWQTPLDAWVKVHAAAFETQRRWERGFSMG